MKLIKTRTAMTLVVVALALGSVLAGDRLEEGFDLRSSGAQILRGVVSEETCVQIREQVFRELDDPSRELGGINGEGARRRDVHLPLRGAIRDAVSHLWMHYWPLFVETLGARTPDEVTLVELSCLLTRPGAAPQAWHRDTDEEPGATRLLSIGIAMQDITEDMGPLEVIPGSHRDPENADPSKTARTKMTMRTGDVIMWDSTIFHRGSSNTSRVDRLIVYFTLASRPRALPHGAVYSLKREMKVRGDAGPKIGRLFRGGGGLGTS